MWINGPNLLSLQKNRLMRFLSRISIVLALWLIGVASFAQEEFHPVASPKAIVEAGNARFTVLTPRLIRMEWAEDGVFEDRATLGVINRNLQLPAFSVRKSSKKLIIKTSDLTLTYSVGEKFGPKTLSVKFAMGTWHPGMDDSANLMGTTRTLDGFDYIRTFDHYDGKSKGYTSDPFDKGLISRDGWAILDESTRHVYTEVDSDWKYWMEERPAGERQDLYIFAYGHDYTDALADFTKISGKIPMPPKYAFGYWWCRYWLYSDYELVDLAQHFKDLSIPADVMIIDMDWHETWEMGRKRAEDVDAAGQWKGWTGYTWKKELFPNPGNLLTDLHNYGLKTSLNLHPASGIQPFEEPYERFVSDYLSRTGEDYDGPREYKDENGKSVYVPFRIDQMAWANAYFNSVLHPMEKMGVDFWWLDWQQWTYSKYTGVNNTFWLNYTFFNDIARRSAAQGANAPRPMIYHRWGGIGSHRYQVGFSGDTYATWKVLGYLPYFTATASNVGYVYWGHDIGGHMQPEGVNFTDPELYTRWLQGGVFTPIFKTHSTKDTSMEKRFWVFPDHFDAMREAIRLRYNLSPYIYTAARQAYDTGVGICRPLYYYYPEVDKAYDCKEEFMFGDDILATVICEPVDKNNGLASRQMWFPEGSDWWDDATGTLYKGGTETTLEYTINENPYYVRANSIIAMASPELSSLQQSSNELWLMAVPGEGKGECTVYEDDGASKAYSGEYATTKISRERTADGIRLRVEAREGSYKGAPSTRLLRLRLPGFSAPSKVLVNGVEVPYSRFAAKDASEGKAVWGYDGAGMEAIVYLKEASVNQAVTIECKGEYAYTSGQKGLMKRMRLITPEAKLVFAAKVSGNLQLTPALLAYAGTASYITEDPFEASKYIEALDARQLKKELEDLGSLPAEFVAKIMDQIKILQ